jgi:F-type H+-transporting ATPase subunit delta
VASSSNTTTELSKRYATALFSDALAAKTLDEITNDIKSIEKMSKDSQDFENLIKSPVISRKDKLEVVRQISKKANFSELASNFLGLLAENNRLSVLEDIIEKFYSLVSEHKGELKVEVISAVELDEKQEIALSEKLKSDLKKDIVLEKKTDPKIIGGLIIKIGSYMVDSSIKSKLKRLQLAMKGVE